jgi:large-conductance mechanosensitive channel
VVSKAVGSTFSHDAKPINIAATAANTLNFFIVLLILFVIVYTFNRTKKNKKNYYCKREKDFNISKNAHHFSSYSTNKNNRT